MLHVIELTLFFRVYVDVRAQRMNSLPLAVTPATLVMVRRCDIRSSISIGERLSSLPNVILTCIWRFFNLNGIYQIVFFIYYHRTLIPS
jgi:hypothetical protein